MTCSRFGMGMSIQMSHREGDTAEAAGGIETPGGPGERTSDGSSTAAPAPTEAELMAAGWTRCFEADEPRLSEAVEIYRELGFEVRLLPVTVHNDGCSECVQRHSDRLRVIYIHERPGGADGSES